MIGHPLKDDRAPAWPSNFGVQNLKAVGNAVGLNLVFQQPLDALLERLLDFAHTHGTKPRTQKALLNQQGCEEMAFP